MVALAVVAAVVLSLIGGAQFSKTRSIEPEAIPIPTDEAALARGEHMIQVMCTGCHGDDLTGGPVFVDPAIAAINAANITGLGATDTDQDLIRAIRHAVAPEGRQLAVMPAEDAMHFSAEDLGAIIAYLKTVPRSGENPPEPSATFMGKVLLAIGMFGDVFPAGYVDHQAPFPAMPEVGANPEYGEYLSRFCYSCHGEDLSGGQPLEPGSPYAPSLTDGRKGVVGR